MWTIVCGACLTQRRDAHVKFTVVADVLPKKWQLIANIFGNTLIVGALILCVIPSIRYLVKIGYQKTAYLRIPVYWAYSPIIIFFVFNIFYFCKGILIEIGELKIYQAKTKIKTESNW
jgi:TRAP-type C4-dicarboxylate transport system permease small subunit